MSIITTNIIIFLYFFLNIIFEDKEFDIMAYPTTDKIHRTLLNSYV